MESLIGQRLGQYEILARIGAGGMATVYRARQTSVDRDVAVKVIRLELVETQTFAERFLREARTVASLSHFHILKIFDYGQNDQISYIVMELIEGGSLGSLIRRNGPVALPLAAKVLGQVADALDYAHQNGIIHRDLKPENVLLDKTQNAFLTDFGIAKLLNDTSSLTQTGTVMGTPPYMAPELWNGQPADARTDIYALGVLLYQTLTGKLPYHADTPYQMMQKHLNEPVPSLLAFNDSYPPTLDTVLHQAMAKDRQNRFASGLALANALQNAIQPSVPSANAFGAVPPPAPTAMITSLPKPAQATQPALRVHEALQPDLSSAMPISNSQGNAAPNVSQLVPSAFSSVSPVLPAYMSSLQPYSPTALSASFTPLASSQVGISRRRGSRGGWLILGLLFGVLLIGFLTGGFVLIVTSVSTTQTAVSLVAAALTTTTTATSTPTNTASADKQTSTALPSTPTSAAESTPLRASLRTATAEALRMKQTVSTILTLNSLNATATQAAYLTATQLASQSGDLGATATAISLTLGFTLTPTAAPNVSGGTVCPGFMVSRLQISKYGRVTAGPPNRLRSDPSLAGKTIGTISGGETFFVLDGPYCADQMAWWKVDYNGTKGWTAEGQDSTYWLEPVSP